MNDNILDSTDKYNANVIENPWHKLSLYTSSRIALGRAGVSVPTKYLLKLQSSCALAKDSVYTSVNWGEVYKDLRHLGLPITLLNSLTKDKSLYLQNPILGNSLTRESTLKLMNYNQPLSFKPKIGILICEGFSSVAIEKNSAALVREIFKSLGTNFCISAIHTINNSNKEIGINVLNITQDNMLITIIGERPNCDIHDSLGIYFDCTKHQINNKCKGSYISNINEKGISFIEASSKLLSIIQNTQKKEPINSRTSQRSI